MKAQPGSSRIEEAPGGKAIGVVWRAALALAGAMLAAAAVLLCLELLHARERAIEAGEKRSRTLAALIESRTAEAMHDVARALRQAAGGAAGAPPGSPGSLRSAEELLRRASAAAEGVRGILVVDRGGRLLDSSGPPFAGGLDPATLTDLQAAPGDAELRLAVPIPVGGEWLLPVEFGPLGAGAVTMVALLHPAHFEHLLRGLEIGVRDSVILYAASGQRIVCNPACPPDQEPPGGHLPAPSDWLSDSREATLHEAGPGDVHVVTYRRVAGLPLVVGVSLDRAEILAEWTREARNALLFGLPLTGVLVVMGVMLHQQFRRRVSIGAALAESETRFRFVADTMPTPLWISDAQGAATFFNRSWLDHTGVALADQLGDGWKASVHPDDLPGLEAAHANSVRTRAPHTQDYRLRRSDGEYRWFAQTVVPRFGPDGGFLGMSGTLQDITDRRQAEKALADSERRFRNLIQNMRNIIFCSGLKGSGGYGYHDGRPRIFGADAQRIAGTVEGGVANIALWYESVLPEDRPAYLEAERRRKELGEPYRIEYRYRHPATGELKWARETGWVVRDEDSGETYFDSFILEITDEKRAAEELRQSEERFRSIVAALSEGVVFLDADGQVRSCNARAEQILGLNADELRGRSALGSDWDIVREDGSPFPDEERPPLVTLRTGKPCSDVRMGIRRPDGALRWISANSEPIFAPGAERPSAVVVSFADVTDRRRAEQALRDSQALLRALIDAVPASINVKTADGRYVLVNAYHQRFHDRPSEWFLGKTVEEAFGGEYARHVMQRDRELVEGGEPTTIIEEEYKEPSGRVGTWLTTKAPVRAADGAITHIVTVAFDVTERRKVEAARREVEARLVAFMRYAPFSMFIKDVAGRYLMINPEGERLFRATNDEVVGRTAADFFPPAFVASAEAHDRAVLESGTVVSREVRNPEGDVYEWSLVIKFPIRDEREAIHSIGSFELDITEKKRAEEALRESEQRFRSMADSVPALVWMSDEAGRCIFVNRRWLEYTGRTLAQELGTGYADSIHPEDRDEVLDAERRAFERHAVFIKDYRLRGAAGEYRWFFDTGAPRFTPHGVYLGHVGLLIDISDRRHLELELQQARRIEAIGQLTGGVAHDFNNLLTVILGNTEMLLSALDPDSRPYLLARLVRLAALRGAEITQRLLAFGRRQTLQPTEIDLNRLVRGLKDLLHRTLGDEIEIEFDLAKGAWIVHADPLQVENALINLALNARDAMPGGGRLTIRTANQRVEPDSSLADEGLPAADYVKVSVADTGAGMSPDIAERAFEPFFTTKGIGRGTGLGLSTVYGFAKQSGGHAMIESAPGRGTTVSILLPRSADDVRDPARTADEPASEAAPSASHQPASTDDGPSEAKTA